MKTEFKQITNVMTDQELEAWRLKGWELIFFSESQDHIRYIFKR